MGSRRRKPLPNSAPSCLSGVSSPSLLPAFTRDTGLFSCPGSPREPETEPSHSPKRSSGGISLYRRYPKSNESDELGCEKACTKA
jgi:hypothetical protein